MKKFGSFSLVITMLLCTLIVACGGEKPKPMLTEPEEFVVPFGEPSAPLPDLGTLSEPPTDNNAVQDQILALINERRAQQGCPPLTRNPQLDAAAYTHSEDMALNDYVAHEGLDGTKFWQRIQATGYTFTEAAENIAAGSTTPEQTVQLWLNSPGHAKNVFNCNLRDTGIGVYHLPNDSGSIVMFYYWTQVFAIPQ